MAESSYSRLPTDSTTAGETKSGGLTQMPFLSSIRRKPVNPAYKPAKAFEGDNEDDGDDRDEDYDNKETEDQNESFSGEDQHESTSHDQHSLTSVDKPRAPAPVSTTKAPSNPGPKVMKAVKEGSQKNITILESASVPQHLERDHVPSAEQSKPATKTKSPTSKTKRVQAATTAPIEAKMSSEALADPSLVAPISTGKSKSKSKSTATVKPVSLDPTPAAPYGYKIIKVKKPDGTVVTVKRALKEGETPPEPTVKKPSSKTKKPIDAGEFNDTIPKPVSKSKKPDATNVSEESVTKSTSKPKKPDDVSDQGNLVVKPVSKSKKSDTASGLEETVAKSIPKSHKPGATSGSDRPSTQLAPKIKKSDSADGAKDLVTKSVSKSKKPDTAEEPEEPIAKPVTKSKKSSTASETSDVIPEEKSKKAKKKVVSAPKTESITAKEKVIPPPYTESDTAEEEATSSSEAKSKTAKKDMADPPKKKKEKKPVDEVSSLPAADEVKKKKKSSKKAPSEISDTISTTIESTKKVKKSSSDVTKKVPKKKKDASYAVQINEKELESVETLPFINHDRELEAQSKNSRRLARLTKISIWALAIFFPLFFLGLGLAAALLNGHEINPKYFSQGSSANAVNDPLTQTITFAASIWPIVFAAVVAQSLKMCAAYKVERGIKLMTLEQLTNSHSMGGALKTPFLLRTFNWTTVGLLLLWSLSPLAGQAILRMSRQVATPAWNNTAVSYYSTVTAINNGSSYTADNNYWSIPFGTVGGGLSGYSYSVEFSLVTALMQGYSQGYLSDLDIYANLKIPILGKTLDSFNPNSTTSGELYSSLLGYPFWIYDRNYDMQTSNFTISSRYYALTCSDPTVISPNASALQMRHLNINALRTFDVSAMNNSQSPFLEAVYWNGTDYVQSDNTTGPSNISTTYMQPGTSGTLYVASLHKATYNDNFTDMDIQQVLYAECPYRSVRLDSFVSCTGVAQNSWCDVINQTEVRTEENSTAMPLGYWFPSVLQQMTNNGDSTFSQLEQFLNNPQFAANSLRDSSQSLNTTVTNLNGITRTQLSERLGLVLNALWNLGLDVPGMFTGPSLQSWQTQSFPYQNITAYADQPPTTYYVAIWGWIACLFICSILLGFAAVAAAIFETRKAGPDFLGFTSSVLEADDITSMKMSGMNARDRLRMLKEREVILHDANPMGAIGKMKLALKEAGHVRLVKARQYD